MVTEQIDPLLRAKEVAAALGISAAQVYSMAATGSLPCVRIGALVRFRRNAIEQFIAANSVGIEQIQ